MNRIIWQMSIYLCVIALLASCNKTKTPTTSEIELNTGWEYKKANDAPWSMASVPGAVHTDLLKDGIIKDPFYRLNEKDQQWIGETDWEYQTSFQLTNADLENSNIELVFEGLDTYADVFLNGVQILTADNMFRTWEVDVRSNLKAGKNELKVYFHNVFKVNQSKYDNASYRLQAFSNNDQADVKLNLYSRKAGFHYGWDWGPRLVTAGVWRPVTLRSWNNFKIDNVYYRQKKVSAERAEITAEFEVSAAEATKGEIVITNEGVEVTKQAVALKPGKNKVAVPFVIDQPKLWWTNGLGAQHLYTFNSELTSSEGFIDSNQERVGIRSLEVVRDKDQFGKSLYVKLNGVPVFMKGANYIPQDNFQNRVTKERYEHIIGSARAANMNMLRVWGGGIYEEDLFYELCDENGILVWQDVMFACGMYPADDDYLESVRNEVIDNVTRLRNHPSVAMYCGNNENEISWYSWGWKDLYTEEIQKQYETDLKKLFYETIPAAIAQADPDRYYHPSSPIAGIGDNRPKEDGDTHYWGVWHGKEPFENFEQNVSRFVSEYGFQSYPEFSSIKKFSEPEDWFLESDVMHAHQRCMADDRKDIDYGNRLINTYLERNFKTPADFEKYIYVVQALQAKGVKQAVESHRRNRTDNYCMGTMYWQIDDCWPVASWSSIDYYGKWKALHYIVKEAYDQVLVTFMEEQNELGVYVVSDELEPIDGASVNLQVLDFKGNEVWATKQDINVKANTSANYLNLNLKEAFAGHDRKSVYVKASLSLPDGTTRENRYFFEKDRHLNMPDAKLTYSGKQVAEGYEITFTSEVFAKYVMISTDVDDAFISDNYFDLDAGTEKKVMIKTEKAIDVSDLGLKVVSLTDSYKSTIKIAQAN